VALAVFTSSASAATPTPPRFQSDSLSCIVGQRFCVAVSSDGYATVYTDGRWTKPVEIDLSAAVHQSTLNGVSCGSTSRCIAWDNLAQNEFMFDGSKWTAVDQSLDPDGGGFQAASCATWYQCVAIDYVGDVLTDTYGFWSISAPIDGSAAVLALDCPTTSFCMAGDALGFAISDYNGRWSTPVRVDNSRDDGITSVTCTSQSFCLEADGSRISTFKNRAWSKTSVGPGPRSITGLSCATTTSCLALGGHQTYLFNGHKWQRVPYTLTAGASASVSCSPAGCVVLDSAGNAVVYSDGKWKAFGAVPGTAGAA
jgi:hypothetical protein